MHKKSEEKLISEIIANNSFSEQKDILIALNKNGIDMPQATLSRRLRKLNVVKINGFYKTLEKSSPHIVINVVCCMPNLIIVKTLPGHAGSIAFVIDDTENPNFLGTIAGDDTIFIAVKHEHMPDALKEVQGLFQILK